MHSNTPTVGSSVKGKVVFAYYYHIMLVAIMYFSYLSVLRFNTVVLMAHAPDQLFQGDILNVTGVSVGVCHQLNFTINIELRI